MAEPAELNWDIGRALVRLLTDRIEGPLPSEPQWRVPPKLIQTEASLKIGTSGRPVV